MTEKSGPWWDSACRYGDSTPLPLGWRTQWQLHGHALWVAGLSLYTPTSQSAGLYPWENWTAQYLLVCACMYTTHTHTVTHDQNCHMSHTVTHTITHHQHRQTYYHTPCCLVLRLFWQGLVRFCCSVSPSKQCWAPHSGQWQCRRQTGPR